ncbi:hypothetical protein [Aquisphaera insulae]|uniref:hypothetical protein n=1 Tax=Aquisphaera insulae TaxID=2712864 RepID=UPI0013EB3C8C|nr:hypothetical protein [Aquisphaera insulae]
MTFQIVPSDGAITCTAIATATATLTGTAVSGFSGLSGGAGYPPSSGAIPVTISGGGGSGALAHAVSNGSGVITSVVLDAGGSEYTSAPRVTIGSSPGYLVFDQPICAAYSSQAAMQAGGSAISPPTDLKLLLAFSRGAISVTKPASGYEGTAFTTNGVERTLYRDFPQWLDYRDTSSYQTLAQEILDTVKNTVVEGNMTYSGKYSSALTLGSALNIAGNGYTTGYEAIAAPIRGVVLDFVPEGGQTPWVTSLSFSTRMRPFVGDRLYQHPGWGSKGFGGMAGGLSPVLPPSWGSGGMATATPPTGGYGQGGGFEGVTDFADVPADDGRTGENHYRRRKPETEEQRRARGRARREEQAEAHADPAGRELQRLAIEGVARHQPAADRPDGGASPSLPHGVVTLDPDQVARNQQAWERGQMEADQSESARRARESERAEIKRRNREKADLKKADPNNIDAYLANHQFDDGEAK